MADQNQTISAADTVTPIWADKAFIAIIIHLVAVGVLAFAHVQLNEANIVGLVVTVVAFCLAHKAKSGIALVALIKAQAEQRYTIQMPAPTLPETAAALDKPVA